ncbi:MAG: TIGR01459 family HAD-type hydrolase [Pseudomonadota bacterium]
MSPVISALSEISHRYDVLFCDLWGCLHNGVAVFPEAVSALTAFREQGGTVVLVTNSPRPRGSVKTQLKGLGAPDGCYDAIATSGDAAQAAMAAGLYGRRIFHIGPERDMPFFTDEAGQPIDVERVAIEEAEGIVCTGLYDDRTETPEDYRLIIARGVNRGLKMLCANPDVIVDVGEMRIYCAGAIAEAYTAAGGTAHYYGKPHAPIYQLARQRAEEARGEEVKDAHILCIGDGINTDIRGAVGEGLDSLFIAGGLAAEETGMANGQPDPAKVETFLTNAKMSVTATIGFLR